MRISDWSSDVCSSDLQGRPGAGRPGAGARQAGGLPGGEEKALACLERCRHRRGRGRDLEEPVAGCRRQDLAVRGPRTDRQSVVSGKSVSVRVDLGGRRILKKKKNKNTTEHNQE